jgi:hypothetical protein
VIAGASPNERPRVASAGPDTGGKKGCGGSLGYLSSPPMEDHKSPPPASFVRIHPLRPAGVTQTAHPGGTIVAIISDARAQPFRPMQ